MNPIANPLDSGSGFDANLSQSRFRSLSRLTPALISTPICLNLDSDLSPWQIKTSSGTTTSVSEVLILPTDALPTPSPNGQSCSFHERELGLAPCSKRPDMLNLATARKWTFLTEKKLGLYTPSLFEILLVYPRPYFNLIANPFNNDFPIKFANNAEEAYRANMQKTIPKPQVDRRSLKYCYSNSSALFAVERKKLILGYSSPELRTVFVGHEQYLKYVMIHQEFTLYHTFGRQFSSKKNE
ncbi:hypothetical protein EVAR_33857_1 [Eumeta japonica]|uniref:Uncharacterized protein n=1 Tax=Eumeta variegata TaxID=151549 RepID=A0A4C1X8E9_EUMVA|nr:hypothetical protein EVAR_33857_1 [Eumeta japonica]